MDQAGVPPAIIPAGIKNECGSWASPSGPRRCLKPPGLTAHVQARTWFASSRWTSLGVIKRAAQQLIAIAAEAVKSKREVARVGGASQRTPECKVRYDVAMVNARLQFLSLR